MELLKKNTAATIMFQLWQYDTPEELATGVTFATGDVKVVDDTSSANSTNLPTEIGSTGVYKLSLTAGELNENQVIVTVADATATKVWVDETIHIKTYNSGYLAPDLSNVELEVDITKIDGVAAASATIRADIIEILGVAAGSTTIRADVQEILGTSASTAQIRADIRQILGNDAATNQIRANIMQVDGTNINTTWGAWVNQHENWVMNDPGATDTSFTAAWVLGGGPSGAGPDAIYRGRPVIFINGNIEGHVTYIKEYKTSNDSFEFPQLPAVPDIGSEFTILP